MSDHGEQPPRPREPPEPTAEMGSETRDEMADYAGRDLLAGQRALVTGGDSGIGRAVAVAFAKEGADVGIAYLSDHDDAWHTAAMVERAGRQCTTIAGDLSTEVACEDAVETTAAELGGLELLVNNVGVQTPVGSLEELSTEQWERTFRTNVHSYFWCTRAALRHIPEGGAIVNTGSINGPRGSRSLIDDAAAKGAINAFTYSLAQALVDRGIRVNCVAAGPAWTPRIPATPGEDGTDRLESRVAMDRTAQPDEITPSYVFLAANRLSSCYTGGVMAPIGGQIPAR